MTVRRGLYWPLILIVVGLLLLLANFGLIAPLSGLALLSLWPVILILVGIDIAIGKRWPVAALAADVLVIGVALALVTTQPSRPSGFFPFSISSSDGTGTSVASVPREGAKALTLRVSGGAARITLSGGGPDLVHAESDGQDLRLRTTSRSGDRMDVRLDQGGMNFIWFGRSAASNVDVRVASDVPTSLQLDAGAGEFLVDLTDVTVTDARMSVGAASLRVVLPKPTGDVPITISAGASSVVIEVPAGVEARVTIDGGLKSSRYDNPRFSGSETTGYAGSKDRVTVRVTSGVGSIIVR